MNESQLKGISVSRRLVIIPAEQEPALSRYPFIGIVFPPDMQYTLENTLSIKTKVSPAWINRHRLMISAFLFPLFAISLRLPGVLQGFYEEELSQFSKFDASID